MLLRMSEQGMTTFIAWLLNNAYHVIGTKTKGSQFVFDRLTSADEFTTEYIPTILPLKKFFMPSYEVLFTYQKDTQSIELPEDLLERESQKNKALKHKPTVYIGIRGCDMESVKILDSMMLDDNADWYYRQHRDNSLFMVFDCQKPMDDRCFCYLLYHKDYSVADVVFYNDETGYLVWVNSGDARELFGGFLKSQTGSTELETGEALDTRFASINLPKPVEAEDSFDLMTKRNTLMDMEKVETVCRKEADNCLNCGSCFMVCPTCYCYTIRDVDDVNMERGERIREWDGCMLVDFTLVADGHRLVPTGVERSIHKFNRKFKNALLNHNRFLCVGCGRCIRTCPAGNSVKSMLEDI